REISSLILWPASARTSETGWAEWCAIAAWSVACTSSSLVVVGGDDRRDWCCDLGARRLPAESRHSESPVGGGVEKCPHECSSAAVSATVSLDDGLDRSLDPPNPFA